MKLSRKLVPAIAMLLVSAVMLSTASFAWFSMNTQVKATGINIQAQAMGSLVIATDKASLSETYATTTVTLATTNPVVLIDATHDVGYPSGLKTVSSGTRDKVNATSGAAGADAVYENGTAATESTAGHYFDKVVYLAAKTQDIAAGKNLVATITPATTNTNTTYFKAVAVDFYVLGTTDASVGAWASNTNAQYKDTVWLDTFDADGAETAEIPNNVSKTLYTEKIPAASSADGGYVKILMRVYIDGAYTGSNSADATPIVNNVSWSSVAVNFDVTFDLK